MDSCESLRRTAEELVAYARGRGFDLSSLLHDFSFFGDDRWMIVWRKDESPSSGRADEALGTLKYNMQGTVTDLPSLMPRDSLSSFRGMWSEAGTLEDLNAAFQLVKAWILERAEIDDLPGRVIRRYQI